MRDPFSPVPWADHLNVQLYSGFHQKVCIGSITDFKLSRVQVRFSLQSGTWAKISFVPLAGCPTKGSIAQDDG
jgi:hypothetical protein